MDVEITPASDPSTVAVIESSVNLSAKAKITVCGSVCLMAVVLLAVFMYSCFISKGIFFYSYILKKCLLCLLLLAYKISPKILS